MEYRNWKNKYGPFKNKFLLKFKSNHKPTENHIIKFEYSGLFKFIFQKHSFPAPTRKYNVYTLCCRIIRTYIILLDRFVGILVILYTHVAQSLEPIPSIKPITAVFGAHMITATISFSSQCKKFADIFN